MKVGVVSWTLGLWAPADVIAKVAALGLDAVQYAGDHRNGHASELREHARKAGITLLAIDPFYAAPADPNTATRNAAIEYYCKVVDYAAEAGQVPVTLQGLSQWTRNCPDRASALMRLTECCQAVNAYAREQGVPTLYEVCNHYEVPLIHTAAECHALLRTLGCDTSRMVLDSFHMNINEPDPLATLRAHAAQTAIYHLSDSNRGGIGGGHIDFKTHYNVLLAAGFTGAVAIEPVLPHLIPSTAPASDVDRQQLDEEIRRSAVAWRTYHPV